jgi:hypothetical protein
MSDPGHPQAEAELTALERYLDDRLPPEVAAMALASLMARPPALVMDRISAWATAKSQEEPIPVSEFLLFALQKVYVVGEIELVDRDAIANFLDAATTLALRVCPVELRETLRVDITAMRGSHATSATRPVPKTASNDAEEEEERQAGKKLALILERFGRQSEEGTPPPSGEAAQQAAAQMLTMAAMSSKSGAQLDAIFEEVRRVTGGGQGNVFGLLGGALPAWELPRPPAGTRKLPAQIGAMEKIIGLAETPAATFSKLRELVVAAVEKFNQGSLPAAMWMLDVAEDSIKSKKLESSAVDRLRSELAERISAAQLRSYVENKRRHGALRTTLEFFPTMRLPALFRRLRGEARAEKRRSLLGLIEIHGEAARAVAQQELDAELARSDVDTYYLRNTIYILHRIPRENDDGLDRQLEALSKASARGQNVYVIREAIAGLGQIRTDAAAKILTLRLAEFEALLLRGDASTYPIPEMQKLLDRIVASLARIGTSVALLTVARHGMKANPLLGDTRSRLAGLAQHDLSFDEECVAVLAKALRDELPGKLLGRFGSKKQEGTARLVEALSGTRSDEVDELLRDVAERCAGQDLGQAAAAALARRGIAQQPAKTETAATLTGELEFFGLPALLQSLTDATGTGVLCLTTKQGQVTARIVILEGKFLDAQRLHLRGSEAMYEILERPLTGSFAFVPYPAEKIKTPVPPRDVLSLLFEGIRRHDELQLALAVVPDDLVLKATGLKPTSLEEETDPLLVREVWLRAVSGRPVGEWGSEINADSYRIRTLLSHWMEKGALVAA